MRFWGFSLWKGKEAYKPFVFQLREAQHDALGQKMKEMDGGEKAEKTINQVIQQRHMKERVELEDQYRREMEAARAEARAQAEELRELERQELQQKHDKVSPRN